MRVLLDTQVFCLLAGAQAELSRKARAIFLDSNNQLYLSHVSIWEMQIKIALRKLQLPVPLRKSIEIATMEQGILPLAIVPDHIYLLESLPHNHGDPFDRLLICQAILERMTILTSDKMFRRYDVKCVW